MQVVPVTTLLACSGASSPPEPAASSNEAITGHCALTVTAVSTADDGTESPAAGARVVTTCGGGHTENDTGTTDQNGQVTLTNVKCHCTEIDGYVGDVQVGSLTFGDLNLNDSAVTSQTLDVSLPGNPDGG